MSRSVRTLFLALAVSFAFGSAAQNFPSRSVILTVGFAPGGGTDTAARVVAKKLAENIGQSVVVENRAGAGGNIAAQHVANAPPDGYTIHLTSVGPMSVAPHLSKSLPYDPRRDIAPIAMGVMFPNVIVVHPEVPAKTLGEYVALARAKPGVLNYGSSGVGGIGHLAGELFKLASKTDIVHVPYKGGGPAMVDLLAGRIGMYLGVPSTVAPHVDAGRLRALGTTGLQRAKIMPNVPTVAEQGYPGFETTNWYAFVTSSKVPNEIIDYWNREIVKVLNDPATIAELAKHGLDPAPSTREELARYIAKESDTWAKVVRDAKITAE